MNSVVGLEPREKTKRDMCARFWYLRPTGITQSQQQDRLDHTN